MNRRCLVGQLARAPRGVLALGAPARLRVIPRSATRAPWTREQSTGQNGFWYACSPQRGRAGAGPPGGKMRQPGLPRSGTSAHAGLEKPTVKGKE